MRRTLLDRLGAPRARPYGGMLLPLVATAVLVLLAMLVAHVPELLAP